MDGAASGWAAGEEGAVTGPESEAVAALAAARADLRTSLESLALAAARALRELAAGATLNRASRRAR